MRKRGGEKKTNWTLLFPLLPSLISPTVSEAEKKKERREAFRGLDECSHVTFLAIAISLEKNKKKKKKQYVANIISNLGFSADTDVTAPRPVRQSGERKERRGGKRESFVCSPCSARA